MSAHDNCEQHDNRGAYALIRFTSPALQRCRNSTIRLKGITENYSGRVVGTAECLEVIETTDGMWKKFMEKCCMLVIEFKNMTLAERWFHHCPEVKQHEYLGGDADVILVPLQKPTPPDEGKRLFQLMDLQCANKQQFMEIVEHDMPDLTAAGPACDAAVAATDKVLKMRGMWDHHYLVLHQWQDRCAFDKWFHSDDYKKWRDTRENVSRTNAILFEVTPPAW